MFFAWIFVFSSMWAAEINVSTPSLAKLIELAEERSPVIRKSKLALEQAEMELRSARAAFLPKLDLESSLGPLAKNPDPDHRPTNWTSSTSIILKEEFYDNGASVTKYKAARTRLERERREYEFERDEQLLKLARTYYDWSSAWQARRIAEAKRDLLRRQFNELEAHYKQGLKTKRDVLRIETEVRRLQIDLLRRDNDLEVVLERLAAQTGVSREELKSAGVTTEEAKLDAALPSGRCPEIKAENHRRRVIIDLKGKEAEYETRLVEREYWPRIALTGEITNKYSDYVDRGNRFDHDPYWGVSAFLTLKYNLWDWGTRSRDLQIARVKEKTVHSDNEQSLRDLNIELRDVWLKLGEFAETVKMTKDLVAIEQRSYSILEAEYRNGRANYLDLITNLNSLIDARSKYAESYFGLRRQQLVYAFHKGAIYEALKQR